MFNPYLFDVYIPTIFFSVWGSNPRSKKSIFKRNLFSLKKSVIGFHSRSLEANREPILQNYLAAPSDQYLRDHRKSCISFYQQIYWVLVRCPDWFKRGFKVKLCIEETIWLPIIGYLTIMWSILRTRWLLVTYAYELKWQCLTSVGK